MTLDLAWTLAAAGDHLRVDYTVTNRGAAPVTLVDQLTVRDILVPEAALVRDTPQPGTIAFTRALVEPAAPVAIAPRTASRALAAGASIHGIARIPLPLTSWLNYAPGHPLAPGATFAILELGYLSDPATAPSQQALLRGVPILLPT